MLKKAILIVIVIFLFITGLFYAYSTITNKDFGTDDSINNGKSDSRDYPASEDMDSEVAVKPPQDDKALIDYFWDLESFNLDKVFYNDDIRGVYDYEDNSIIVAYPKVIEYDFDSDRLTRISSELSICAFSGVIYKDHLFLSCNSETFGDPANIQKINLDTGEVVMETRGIEDYDVINARLLVYEDTLFISSWDGVFILNENLEIEKEFTMEDIGFIQCNYSNVNFFKDNGFYGFCVTSDEIFSYDLDNEIWEFVDDLEVEFGDYYNLRSDDYGIDIPLYFVSSGVVNDKVYLLSTLGVEVLNQYTMPKRIVNVDLTEYYLDFGLINEDAYKLYITSEEYYGVMLLRHIYQGPSIDPFLGQAYIVVFDLVDKSMKDITSELTDREREQLLELFVDDYSLRETTFNEVNDFEVEVLIEGTPTITIDLSNLSFQEIEN